MVEEIKEEPKEEPSFLAKVQAEKAELQQIRDDLNKQLNELKELRAEQILSGQTSAGKTEQKKEYSPKEYAEAALKGVILK